MSIPAPIHANADATSARWPLIDAARGAAIAAMIAYHFAWDLSFYRYISVDIARDQLWSRFAELIAASFLFLVGVSLALASHNGLRRDRYLRRLILIAGAAMLVSLGTAFAVPHAPVQFGILHCIALVSVLLIPFLQAPVTVVAATGLIALALPLIARSAMFDGLWWTWLGLAETNAPAVDHVPILPWAGCAFLGLAAARVVLEREALAAWRARLGAWRPASTLSRALILAGRWSLLIYVLHQPVLMAALWPLAPSVRGAAAIDDSIGFRSACEQRCRATGASAVSCETYCGCAVRELRSARMWDSVLRDRISPEEQTKISEITQRCAAPPRPQ
ncbi:MAG: heparan-alpha-glucosaminide N-acetyltransferase [Beijerinckiaceae bacterium]